MRTRLLIGVVGFALAGFGAYRLLTEVDTIYLQRLGVWLIAAVILHDGVLSPLLGSVGLLTLLVPDRARRYVQGAIAAGLLIVVVATFFIVRSGHHQPAVKAILRQDYLTNLWILLGIVAAAALLLYFSRVARDLRSARQATSDTNARPPADHSSPTS